MVALSTGVRVDCLVGQQHVISILPDPAPQFNRIESVQLQCGDRAFLGTEELACRCPNLVVTHEKQENDEKVLVHE